MRRWLTRCAQGAALAAALTAGAPLLAAPHGEDEGRRAARPPNEQAIVDTIQKGEYEKALELIDRALASRPDDPLLHYNAACALALWGKPDDAIERLQRAVEHGFRDFQHMERDPDLASLRERKEWRELLARREEAGRSAALREVERWRTRFGDDRYRYESDEHLNLHFATALDERLHRRMIRMLTVQAEAQIRELFAGAPEEPVFVAIPTRQDAGRFFAELAARDRNFDQPNVAGVYEHRQRRLVCTDTGPSLRHEFTHAMHYGDMERLGQPHPLWIQEGLATLWEDYDLDAEGRVTFLPNDRDDVVRELLRTGAALPWRTLFSLESREFMQRPQQLYPQVRSMFRFLASQRKLTAWYRAYTKGFAEDRHGVKAFEEVFGGTLGEVELAWQQWALGRGLRIPAIPAGERLGPPQPLVRDLPPVRELPPVRPPPASDAPLRTLLGLSLEAREGVRVLRVLPESTGARAGVKAGDVILSIDGTATDGVSDAVAAVVRRKPGDTVELVLRRDREYLRLRVPLAGEAHGDGEGRDAERESGAGPGVEDGERTQHDGAAGDAVSGSAMGTRITRRRDHPTPLRTPDIGMPSGFLGHIHTARSMCSTRAVPTTPAAVPA